jgi:uncharacterized protein (DUF362 family)
MTRKDFIKRCVASLALFSFAGLSAENILAKETDEYKGSNGRPKRGVKGDFDLVVSKGDDPYDLTVKAVETLGGMERFVKKDSIVVVKPNIGWDRTPEQAGNTNPFVVAALIDMAYKAGAKKVKVFDVTCNSAQMCYKNSGIEEAAKKSGAEVFYPEEWNVVKAKLPYASPFNGWPVLKDAIECDTFINVPVLKHHGLSRLTISMKNLMGVCEGDRGQMHQNIGPMLADLTDFISPDLTVVDAYRVLTKNGPQGGNLRDVTTLKTVVAGTDPVLIDSYAATLAQVDPMSLPYIKAALDRKLGSADIASASVKEIEA